MTRAETPADALRTEILPTSAHDGCTLTIVADGDNAISRRQAAVEVLALNVFGVADRDGVPVTRKLVDRRLAELAQHPGTCGCGLCALVPLAAPSKVYWTASRWQISINCTRARATR